jgi:hypothetical protein
MMRPVESYGTARGVEASIKAAAKKAAAEDPSLDTNKRIQLEYFNRFLSRIFSEGVTSDWVLKGGTGMLARIPSTRSTRDVDLYRQGFSLDQALVDLKRLTEVDLGDHFRFEYAGHEEAIGAETQPYTEGYRVSFNVFIGAMARGSLHVDLAVGAGMTAQVTTNAPASTLELPKLVSYPYRLYPVVDQIADKVCATMNLYDGRVSSREKDLVDLVVLAATQDIDGAALSFAIDTERRRRQMVPNSWGRGYTKLSRSVPHCADYRTVTEASELVARLIDPALTGHAEGKSWSHEARDWA